MRNGYYEDRLSASFNLEARVLIIGTHFLEMMNRAYQKAQRPVARGRASAALSSGIEADMTLRRVKVVSLIATSLLFVNLIGGLAAIVVPVVANRLALTVGLAYGVTTGVIAVFSARLTVDYRHLLPAASAVHVLENLRRGPSLGVFFLIMAIFGFVAISLSGAGVYTWLFGSPAERAFTVIDSHWSGGKHGRRCHEHTVEGVFWFASGGGVFCFDAALPQGSKFVLTGSVSSFGMLVGDTNRDASNKAFQQTLEDSRRGTLVSELGMGRLIFVAGDARERDKRRVFVHPYAHKR